MSSVIVQNLLTGAVTGVGLLLYLESQAPARRRAYVMLRRMGLSASSHRRALLGELALPLTAGLLGGLAVTAGLTAVLSPDFDVNPVVQPDTFVDVPCGPLGLIIAALYAQRRIQQANPSEVLRDTL